MELLLLQALCMAGTVCWSSQVEETDCGTLKGLFLLSLCLLVTPH